MFSGMLRNNSKFSYCFHRIFGIAKAAKHTIYYHTSFAHLTVGYFKDTVLLIFFFKATLLSSFTSRCTCVRQGVGYIFSVNILIFISVQHIRFCRYLRNISLIFCKMVFTWEGSLAFVLVPACSGRLPNFWHCDGSTQMELNAIIILAKDCVWEK